MKFVNLKNDSAFVKIFADQDKPHLLIEFLNAILELTHDKSIREVTLLNLYRTPKLANLNHPTLMIEATDHRNISYIIHFEIAYVANLNVGLINYIRQANTSQFDPNMTYPKQNQIIYLGLLDFVLFEHHDDYLSSYHILGKDLPEQGYDDIQIILIELPKFNKTSQDINNFREKWLYFINYSKDLDQMPAHVVEPVLIEAYQAADQHTWTKKDLEVYEYWGIRIQDERGAFEFAYEKGLAKGRAIRMKADGLALDLIAKYTGLSTAEIEPL